MCVAVVVTHTAFCCAARYVTLYCNYAPSPNCLSPLAHLFTKHALAAVTSRVNVDLTSLGKTNRKYIYRFYPNINLNIPHHLVILN